MCSVALFIKYEITDLGPQASLGPTFSRQAYWKDIEKVYEDSFSSIRLFIFKGRKEVNNKGFGLNNAITNYKDFLREAIMRVRPDTEVEEKILQLVGFTKVDIGKMYRSSAQTQPSP